MEDKGHTIIFLVDDSTDEREFFIYTAGKITSDADLDIRTYTDGVSFLEYLTHNRLRGKAMIFMDVNMPRLNGLECLKILREKYYLHNIPVVMFSHSEDEKDIEIAQNYGADMFVVKPDTMEKLTLTIESVLDNLENGRPRNFTVLNVA